MHTVRGVHASELPVPRRARDQVYDSAHRIGAVQCAVRTFYNFDTFDDVIGIEPPAGAFGVGNDRRLAVHQQQRPVSHTPAQHVRRTANREIRDNRTTGAMRLHTGHRIQGTIERPRRALLHGFLINDVHFGRRESGRGFARFRSDHNFVGLQEIGDETNVKLNGIGLGCRDALRDGTVTEM